MTDKPKTEEKVIQRPWLKVWLVIAFLALVGFSFLPYINNGYEDLALWQGNPHTRLSPDTLLWDILKTFEMEILHPLPIFLGVLCTFCGLIGVLVSNKNIFERALYVGTIFVLMFTGTFAGFLQTGSVESPMYSRGDWAIPPRLANYSTHRGMATCTDEIGLWLFLAAAVMILLALIINTRIAKSKRREALAAA